MADIKLYGKLVANTEDRTVVDTTSVEDVTNAQKLDITLANLQSSKQDVLTFDNVPTQHSDNPVKSNGIYESIEDVREVAEGKKQTFVVSDVTNVFLNSQEEIVSTSTNIVDINGNTIVLSDLQIGDTLYVIELDVPDRWVANKSNGVVGFAKLETAKVPVNDVRVNGTSVVTNQIANVSVPTELSALSQDSTHRLVTDSQITTWDAKQDAISSSNKIFADYINDTNATNKFATASQLEQIATNTNNITTNTNNIATNTSNIATNTANIATNTADIATNTSNIATNTSNISANTTAINGIKNGSTINSFAGVESALADKQDTLTEGNGIIISNNEISIDTSVVATQEDLPEGEVDITINGTPTATTIDLNNIVVGDTTYVNPAQTNYIQGTGINITETAQGKQISVDTTTIQTKIDSSNKISSDLVNDSNATNKFVTTSEKTTWSGKQDALVSGTNIKTINNESLLGSGNITVGGQGNIEVVAYQSQTPITAEQIAKAQNGKLAVYKDGKLYTISYISSSLINFSHYTIGHTISSSANVNDALVAREYLIQLFTDTGMLNYTGYMPVDAVGDYANNFLDPSVSPSTSGKKLIKEALLAKTQGMIAPEYDTTALYDVGDFVTYQNDLYRCITQIAVAEEWNSTHWENVSIVTILDSKQDTLVSGTNIKTINSQSILGNGDISIESGISQSDADARYLKLSGGTMTGALTTSGYINANADIRLANNKSIRNADNGYLVISSNGASTYVGDASSSASKLIFLQQAGVKVRHGSTEYDVLDASNTSANPTLSGGETTLSSLKLNGTNYAVESGISQSDADARYLKLAGGTMTGDLKLGSAASLIDAIGYNLVNGLNGTALGNTSNATTILSNNTDISHNKNGTKYNILDASNTSANPTLSGGETELTSLKLNGTNYALGGGTEVIANPTLSGNEQNLSAVQIDNVNYKIDFNDTIYQLTLSSTSGSISTDVQEVLTHLLNDEIININDKTCTLIGKLDSRPTYCMAAFTCVSANNSAFGSYNYVFTAFNTDSTFTIGYVENLNEIPVPTTSDNGKVLGVSNGSYSLVQQSGGSSLYELNIGTGTSGTITTDVSEVLQHLREDNEIIINGHRADIAEREYTDDTNYNIVFSYTYTTGVRTWFYCYSFFASSGNIGWDRDNRTQIPIATPYYDHYLLGINASGNYARVPNEYMYYPLTLSGTSGTISSDVETIARYLTDSKQIMINGFIAERMSVEHPDSNSRTVIKYSIVNNTTAPSFSVWSFDFDLTATTPTITWEREYNMTLPVPETTDAGKVIEVDSNASYKLAAKESVIAGYGLSKTGNELSVDTNTIATKSSVDDLQTTVATIESNIVPLYVHQNVILHSTSATQDTYRLHFICPIPPEDVIKDVDVNLPFNDFMASYPIEIKLSTVYAADIVSGDFKPAHLYRYGGSPGIVYEEISLSTPTLSKILCDSNSYLTYDNTTSGQQSSVSLYEKAI